MTSIYPVNRPQPTYPKNLRHLSHLKLQRISSIDSTASAVSTPRTYASARREEKEKDELHASGGTWIELFYDLFFAASLSSFSRTREISGRADLVDLAAYFSESSLITPSTRPSRVLILINQFSHTVVDMDISNTV